MLVAISECHSPCRPRHSICLLPLLNLITYVNPGIPSYPSVKSPLLLPLLLPHPIPTSFPSPLPPSHLPPSFPIAPLSISSSRCPPPHCTLFPSLLLPFPSPPPRCHPPLPVAIHPSPSPFFLSTLPTSHFPLPSPLSALASPSAYFSPLPLPPRQLGSLIDSNQVRPTYQ